jgi:predicted phage terminase large subunit-like protein
MTAFCLSTNPKVALRDADFCRDLVKSPWYQGTFQPWWDFSPTQDAKGQYANSAGGWRASQGWTADAVGQRADMQLADDPNDPDKSFSEAERQGVNDRWENTLESRVNDPDRSIRIGVQQRVHPEDWSFHVLNREGDWEHLLIEQEKSEKPPCECATCRRGHTALGWSDTRAPGDLALPERFGHGYVAQQKRNSMRWSAQHQQNPLASEGNLFKASWWRFWRYAWEEPIPELAARTVVIDPDEPFELEESSWDCAFKGTEGSSKVAGGAWGFRGPDKYLMDLVWKPLSFTETCAELQAQCERRPRIGAKVIEDKANGPAVINFLASKVPGLVPFKVNQYGDKEARAAATAWHVEGGNVFLPLHAEWRDRYIQAHSAAPKGAGMDAVDHQSQILLRCQSGSDWGTSGFDLSAGPERRM